MPTLEEITAWSNEQLLAELKNAVPKGTLVDYAWDPIEGYWRLALSRLDENGIPA